MNNSPIFFDEGPPGHKKPQLDIEKYPIHRNNLYIKVEWRPPWSTAKVESSGDMVATFRTSTGLKIDEKVLQTLVPRIPVSLKAWIDKPRGLLLVEEDLPHRGGRVCWTPLRTWPRGDPKVKEDLVEASRSEDHQKVEAAEEVKMKMHAAYEVVKKERLCFSIARMWWSKAKNAETKLIIDDDFQRKAEAKIDNEKNSGQKDTEWQTVGRKRRTKAEGRHAIDEDSLKHSDSSVNLICENSMCQIVGRRKR